MKRTILAALLALVWGSAHAAESTISVTVGSGTTVLGASATSGAHSGAFSSRINIGDSTNPAVAAVVDANGLHVAISDGADVALGAQADAAYSGTGSGSLISISKGIFGALSGNLGVTITSPVDGSGNILVSPVGITVADEGAFTAGTSTFSTIGGFFQTTATSNPLTNGQAGVAQMTANRALMVNLRDAAGVALVGAAGTAATPVLTIQGIASMTKLLVTPDANSAVNLAQVAGTTTSVGNGSSDNGTQRVAIAPNALTTFFLQPTASDNHANIKNGAGTVYNVVAFNNSATVNYIRLYNAATGFNGCNSATGLITQFQVPALTTVGGFSVSIPQGLAFSTGISICVTSGYATTDTTNATATAMSVTVGYL